MHHFPVPETMRPDIPVSGGSTGDLHAPITRLYRRGASGAATPIERRPSPRLDPAQARSLVRLEDLPTIAAIGPFDDREYAQQLAASFIAVRQHCTAQLLLVGAGVQRISVARTAFAQGLGNSVHSVTGNSCDDWWSNLVAAADVVVLNSSANVTTLLDVLDVGRPVVAPADPATTQLLVPAIAGLVYQPGDVSEMTGALLRLLSTPVLRRGMGGRAKHVARRHHLENGMRNKSEEGRRI